MNWTIIIIEALVLTVAFTAMILITLVKNPVWWIADYPEDIQEEYFKTHERIPAKFFTPTVLLKKGMAMVVCQASLSFTRSAKTKTAKCGLLLFCGERGIRTPGTVTRTTV